MKTMTRISMLLIALALLAGCSSTCKKCQSTAVPAAAPVAVAPATVVAPAPVVAAPVTPAPVQEEPAGEVIPAAVRK